MTYPVIGFVGTISDDNYPVLSFASLVYQRGEEFYVSWYPDHSKDLGVSRQKLEEAAEGKQATLFTSTDIWISPERKGSVTSFDYPLTLPRVILLQVRGSFRDFICEGIGPVDVIEHQGAWLLVVNSDTIDLHLANKSRMLSPELLSKCSEDELRVLSACLPFNEMLAQARVDRVTDPVRKEKVQRTVNLQREAAAKRQFYLACI